MDLRSGHPFWLMQNGLPATFPPLEEDTRCDVVVAGAGITGALMAWHLAEAGFSVVVVDKRDAAWGSTAASTALLQYEIDTPLRDLIPVRGEDAAVRSYQACRDAIGKLADLTARLKGDCGFSLRRSLYVAPNQRAAAALRDEFALRKQQGFDVEWWDPADFRKHLPFERPGGIYSRDGGQVDAYKLAYLLLAQGTALGVKVHDRTTLTKFEFTPRGVTVSTDRGALIRARHIVFATGYEATGLLRRDLVSLQSSFALASEPLPAPVWHEECLIWEKADPYLYMRTTADHRIIIGGEDEEFQDPDKRDALIPEKTRALLRKFRRYFPDIPIETAFAWAGTFGATEDGLPWIGRTKEYPRAYFALGFGGNGITYSILAAEIIRDALLKRKSPYEGLFGFDR